MSKCLVFVSSRKQVRYITEMFKHLKLGMLFLDIYRKQKQVRALLHSLLLVKKNTLFHGIIAPIFLRNFQKIKIT